MITEYTGGGLPTTGRHLFKFYNFTCGPCRAVDAELRRGVLQDGVESTVSIDMFEHPDLVKQYAVRAVPTVLFVDDGEIKAAGVGTHALRDIQQACPDVFKPINPAKSGLTR